MNQEENRLYEYRICYNIGLYHAEVNSYHYYQAFTPEDALDFHCKMMERRNIECQIISVEQKCPWSDRWLEQKQILENES